MSQPAIDYSGIKQDEVAVPSSWRPPRHVYFGKRDPNTGVMDEEPAYVHQEFPRMIYQKRASRIVADVVTTQHQLDERLSDGWVKTPGELGLLTAPSFEQWQAMQEEGISPGKRSGGSVADSHVPDASGQTAAAPDLAEQYRAKFGRAPHHRMAEANIQKALDAA
jgi:hypothetical protein